MNLRYHLEDRLVLALCGGVGGAKLALGLAGILPGDALRVAVNTGDDFTHLGMKISQDIDTVVYTLAGLSDPVKGWGRRDETWTFMRALSALQTDSPGSISATAALPCTSSVCVDWRAGEPLSAVTHALRQRLGIKTAILPMSDDLIATRVHTCDGWLDFQQYFVRFRCEPAVDSIEYVGANHASSLESIVATLLDPHLRAVVICPSNPMLSIAPFLAIPRLRQLLRECPAPVRVFSVSPSAWRQRIRSQVGTRRTAFLFWTFALRQHGAFLRTAICGSPSSWRWLALRRRWRAGLLEECLARVNAALAVLPSPDAMGCPSSQINQWVMKLYAARGACLLLQNAGSRAGEAFAIALELAERNDDFDHQLRGWWGNWSCALLNGRPDEALLLAYCAPASW